MMTIPIVIKGTWLHGTGIFWSLLDIDVTFWVQFWYAPTALKTSLTCSPLISGPARKQLLCNTVDAYCNLGRTNSLMNTMNYQMLEWCFPFWRPTLWFGGHFRCELGCCLAGSRCQFRLHSHYSLEHKVHSVECPMIWNLCTAIIILELGRKVNAFCVK